MYFQPKKVLWRGKSDNFNAYKIPPPFSVIKEGLTGEEKEAPDCSISLLNTYTTVKYNVTKICLNCLPGYP